MTMKKLLLVAVVLGAAPLVFPVSRHSGLVLECKNNASNLVCAWPRNCKIGHTITVNCTTTKECGPEVSLKKAAPCNFCWQMNPDTDYDCMPVMNCSTSSTRLYRTRCVTRAEVLCIGNRAFYKRMRCNWSSGVSWTKTMFLSVVMGGFGADRFYLGLWKSGIGKMFSFGGLGIWTIVDVVLIAVGYIKPADGSLYI